MMEQEGKSKKVVGILIAVLCIALIGGLSVVLSRPWEKIGNIDDRESIDLTHMSGTMVYLYVYDMLFTRPDAYIGKTIRTKGLHSVTYYAKTDKYYHYLVISDAAACCAQGVEFEYENEYPEENKEIEVVGIFEKYEELGITYYYLRVSEMIVVSPR